jgi:signal transduction histidine kinase
LSIVAEPHCVGMWDRARIDSVATNLLSNAIKFGLGKPIEISVTTDNGRARLIVRDHGAGVSRDKHTAIFEPFERAVSVRNYGGLGLGLYIVRTIVDGLGGTVSVESEPGNGATFTVDLPLTRSA